MKLIHSMKNSQRQMNEIKDCQYLAECLQNSKSFQVFDNCPSDLLLWLLTFFFNDIPKLQSDSDGPTYRRTE